MALSNRELRKQLKDALADQKGIVTSKLAANQPLSESEEQLLKNALADMKGLSAKLAQGIGAGAEPSEPSVPAEAASFTGQVDGMSTDVTIDADNAGAAGNVTLGVDGIMDLDALIAGWNIAYPLNTLTLSSGDGEQIPSEDIVLSGGSDEIPEVPATDGIQLSDEEKKDLRDALADQNGELTAAIAAGTDFSS